MRWRQSAALRISLAWSAGFALGTIVLGAVVFLAMHLAFMRQMDGFIAQEARTLSDEYRSGGLAELREAIADREAAKAPSQTLYAVFSADGRRIAGNLSTTRPPAGTHDIVFHDGNEGRDSARAFATDLPGGLRLVVAQDREWIERIDGIIVGVFALGFAGVIAFGTLSTILLATYLRRRLEGFRDSAEHVIAGRIGDRMPVSPRDDEFDELAEVLNAMLDRIEALVNNLRQVSNDIAHDLRTPLARLRQQLEQAAGSARGTAAEQDIADALARTDDVLGLFSAILHLSEVERGGELPLGPIDISALTTEVAEIYEPSLREGGRTLEWKVEAGAVVTGERTLIAQALSNLLENAQRHTPMGTRVTIDLHGADGMAVLSVSDDGPGIAPAEHARAIARFERLDASRTTPGFGLGLALVDAVARRLSGRLELHDAAPGLRASIVLPLCRTPNLIKSDAS